MTYDLLNQLPDEATRVGKFLRQILPPAFRNYRQRFGVEGIHAHDSVALLAATNPDLFVTQEMAGDVEIQGELTTGMTVFDRRRIPTWRNNMEVAVDMDTNAVVAQLGERLSHAAT